MLNLVLRNLVSNAIKFTPEKGNISVGVHEQKSFVEIYIKDNGTGISHDALVKINDNNFYTTKGTASESGTGLGLMLCKEYLARNGGKLHIESKIGEGSEFIVHIPLELTAAEVTKKAKANVLTLIPAKKIIKREKMHMSNK